MASNVAPSYMSISADVHYTLLHRRTVHPSAARLLTRIIDLALRKVEARCDAPILGGDATHGGSVEAAYQMQVVSLQRFAMPIEMAEQAFANDLCG